MKSEKDILERIGKGTMSVPDGYFSDLKNRLATIPESATVQPGPWNRVRPYLAMAASFAAILIIGNSVLRNTASKPEDELFLTDATYAAMISLNYPDAILNAMEFDEEVITDEDIINYLIESGVRTEHLAYAGNQY